MGFSTNITISNDFWHKIKEDPQKLVDVISHGMNDGAGELGPVREALDAKWMREDEERADRIATRQWRDKYEGVPQGVIVHKARHNDEAQVIASTYGSHAVAAHEIPYAIRLGWLDLNDYHEKQAERVAKELHNLARDIRRELREAKERREQAGTTRVRGY